MSPLVVWAAFTCPSGKIRVLGCGYGRPTCCALVWAEKEHAMLPVVALIYRALDSSLELGVYGKGVWLRNINLELTKKKTKNWPFIPECIFLGRPIFLIPTQLLRGVPICSPLPAPVPGRRVIRFRFLILESHKSPLRDARLKLTSKFRFNVHETLLHSNCAFKTCV